MSNTKIVVFEHQYGHGKHNKLVEEVEVPVDADNKFIQETFEDWVWERIGDEFHWYVKGEDEDE